MMRIVLHLSLLASLLASLTRAEKDSDYYYPGFTNPNTKHAMYWKDSVNVLQDLDQFQALYVTYHHCVWSIYGQRYGSGEDYDEQGGNNDDEDSNNGCGGYGGEFFWYMGRTQCFKANVAYSLYGVLKGEEIPKNACAKGTYINSFFTTFGIESFTGPLGLGVDAPANSQCTSVEPENAYVDDDKAQADDDYLDDNFQMYDYPAYTSYGTGCSAGNFVTDSYQGAFCHGRNYLETTDTLDNFNELVRGVECLQVYSSSSYQQRRTEQEDINFEELDAIGILSYSKSCSLRQYPKDCPDPYGLKKKYGKAIDRAFEYKTGSSRDIGTKLMTTFSWISLAGGLIFFVLAYLVQRRSSLQAAGAKKKRSNWLSSKKSRSSDRSADESFEINRSESEDKKKSKRKSRGKFRSKLRSKSRSRSNDKSEASKSSRSSRRKSRSRSKDKSEASDKNIIEQFSSASASWTEFGSDEAGSKTKKSRSWTTLGNEGEAGEKTRKSRSMDGEQTGTPYVTMSEGIESALATTVVNICEGDTSKPSSPKRSAVRFFKKKQQVMEV